MKTEEWRPVPGYEGSYSVSSRGQVRSEFRRFVRCNGVRCTVQERFLRPAQTSGTRRVVTLIRRGQGKKSFSVAALQRAAFGGAA